MCPFWDKYSTIRRASPGIVDGHRKKAWDHTHHCHHRQTKVPELLHNGVLRTCLHNQAIYMAVFKLCKNTFFRPLMKSPVQKQVPASVHAACLYAA